MNNPNDNKSADGNWGKKIPSVAFSKKKDMAKKISLNHKGIAKHLELGHGNPKYHKAMDSYLKMSHQDQDLVIRANKNR